MNVLFHSTSNNFCILIQIHKVLDIAFWTARLDMGNSVASTQTKGNTPFDHKRYVSMFSRGKCVWDLIYKCLNTCHSFALTGTVESEPEKEVPAV